MPTASDRHIDKEHGNAYTLVYSIHTLLGGTTQCNVLRKDVPDILWGIQAFSKADMSEELNIKSFYPTYSPF